MARAQEWRILSSLLRANFVATKDDKYNGWTNYATWRVNLELCGDRTPEDYGITEFNKDEAPRIIEEWVSELVDENRDGFVKNYCNAFLSYVDWREIAEHVVELLDEDEN
jgi:hypothetical protein